MRPNSVRNKVSEIIVERRDDDEEILSSQDKAAEPTGLFDGVEAVQAMVEDFEFNPRDAQQHVRRYGADAVIQTLQKAEYYRKHNKPVKGKPVANWRGFIVTDLKNGFPQDPQVLEAARKAERAEAAKVDQLAKEERDRAEMAKQAQDAAFVEMVLANKSKQELESLREQVAMAESVPMMARRQRKRALEHPGLRKAMADIVMNNQVAARTPSSPHGVDLDSETLNGPGRA